MISIEQKGNYVTCHRSCSYLFVKSQHNISSSYRQKQEKNNKVQMAKEYMVVSKCSSCQL